MGQNEINVIKRNGESEPLNYEKINKVLIWATNDINGVSASDVAMNAQMQLYDKISTNEIHQILIQSASNMITEKTPNYQYVASNLLNYYIRKNIFGVQANLPRLVDVIHINIRHGVYDKKILEWYSEDEINKINSFIKHDRDYKFTYAGLQQVIDKYLLKDRKNDKLYETPQFMYMLIAMTLFKDYNNGERIAKVRSYYNDISKWKISLPTPIMSGVRTPNRQYSSCTLISVGDSLESIANSNSAVMYYTAKRAGIGLNFGRVRAVGDTIRGGEVIHTGVIPFLKMFEKTTKSCTQNGIRGGSSTTFFPFWHKEIQEILVLKNNRGTDDNRVRHMDYGIQFNRLFYRRFISDENISLFSPNDTKDLYNAMLKSNDEFEKLYDRYENDDTIDKITIKARDLMTQFAKERIETGRMYVMNIDHANTHSSFLDPIEQSNLCMEITLPTTPITHIDDGDDDEGEIALCVLSAINLGEVKQLSDMESICENAVRSLDAIIDHQDYPVAAARKMLKRRSIGVGVTNFAYWLAKHGLSYDDPATLPIVDVMMEHFQYYLLKASNNLAKEKGACEWFNRTKYSQGILPIDTYEKNVDEIVKRELTLDWETLRKDIKKYGLRNSTLSAFMPVESSSVVSNSTNGIEPIRQTITTKKSKQKLLRMVVPEYAKLKNKYDLAFDLKDNRGFTNIQAVMTKYIDQAISGNHYYDPKNYEENNISIGDIIKDLLYSYKMGLKTLYYANTNDQKSDDFTDKISEELNNLKNDNASDHLSQNDSKLELHEIDDDACAGGACVL